MSLFPMLDGFSLLAQSSSGGGGAAAGVAAGGFVLVFFAIGIIASIFWLWMLIDCLTSSLPSTEKLIWFLVIFFFPLLGALLYFFIARGNRSGRVIA